MNPSSTGNRPVDLDTLGSLESRMSCGVPAAVADWERACASLCAWEQEHLDADSTSEELAQHERWLGDLLAWGCEILKAVRKPDFEDKAMADSVAEQVEHLDDKYGVWHSGMTSENEGRVINAAFE
jgi:hypothetical protein